MTQDNRAALKALFQTGDTLLQTSFEDLIDSCLNLTDTATQTIASNVIFSGSITVSGNTSFNNIQLTNITAVSANITNLISTTVQATRFNGTDAIFTNAVITSATTINLQTTNITAVSANITNLISTTVQASRFNGTDAVLTNAVITSATATNLIASGGILNNVGIGVTTPTSIRAYMPNDSTFTSAVQTLGLTDAEYFKICSSGSSQSITVPANASVAFPIDTEIVLFQQGAGQVSVSAAGGVTIQSVGNALKIASQYGVASLKKIGTNTWCFFGNIST